MRIIITIALAALLPLCAHAQSDPTKASAGEEIYEANCVACHGEKLRNPGQSFDLRQFSAADRARYDRAVRIGKGQMPPWAGVLSDDEIDQVWHYIRANAEDR